MFSELCCHEQFLSVYSVLNAGDCRRSVHSILELQYKVMSLSVSVLMNY